MNVYVYVYIHTSVFMFIYHIYIYIALMFLFIIYYCLAHQKLSILKQHTPIISLSFLGSVVWA